MSYMYSLLSNYSFILPIIISTIIHIHLSTPTYLPPPLNLSFTHSIPPSSRSDKRTS